MLFPFCYSQAQSGNSPKDGDKQRATFVYRMVRCKQWIACLSIVWNNIVLIFLNGLYGYNALLSTHYNSCLFFHIVRSFTLHTDLFYFPNNFDIAIPFCLVMEDRKIFFSMCNTIESDVHNSVRILIVFFCKVEKAIINISLVVPQVGKKKLNFFW